MLQRHKRAILVLTCTVWMTLPHSALAQVAAEPMTVDAIRDPSGPTEHREDPVPRRFPRSSLESGRISTPATVWTRGVFESVQVNVDAQGFNVVGDAGNEPSIAVDPTNPARIAIGWRQFDTIADNFRQSGIGYSHDGGQTWSSPEPNILELNEFSSDPILDSDLDGRFYYYALQPDRGPGAWACYMYRSADGGNTWPQEVYAFGGDKAWFMVDKTGGAGSGHVYARWNSGASCCPGTFTRSTDGGFTYSVPITVPSNPRSGTLTVTPDGNLFIVGGVGSSFGVVRSTNAQFANQSPILDPVVGVDLGGSMSFAAGPNPGGLLGQAWIASDHSGGPRHGNLYVLASVDPPGLDPLDVMFVRSTDGGFSWSTPVRVNDDPLNNGAWQWFGTMSVAPNGRIDVVWNDTRNDATVFFSELYYSSSLDGGVTWAASQPLSPPFNHFLGYPNQSKIGDYYHMISDNFGAHLAYAATFNGEQDVYYLRLGRLDCNGNGIPDSEDIAEGTSLDCNQNDLPDECDADCNNNDLVDDCEITDGGAADCNSNLVPDECDPDLDGDTVPDDCDSDIDGDGVLNVFDICDFTPIGLPVTTDGRPLGDFNLNCVVDLLDYNRFHARRCMSSGGPGVFRPLTCTNVFDFDFDLDVDLKDFGGFQRSFGVE